MAACPLRDRSGSRWCGCRLRGCRSRMSALRPPGAGVRTTGWTLARVTTLIGRLIHVRYTLRCTSYLLHRIGFTPQVPVHCAVERDEDAITAWHAVTWAKVRG